MKKIIALALALMMALALCACGDTVTGPGPAEPPADAPATEPADTPTDAPEEPTDAPEEPTDAPEVPDVPAEGGDLTAFYDDTIAKHEFPAMVLAEGDMLEMFYPGLSSLDGVEEFQVYTPMMTGAAAELTLVKLADGGDPAAVKDIFDARVAACTKDGENYPETIDAWVNNCRQVTAGSYMMLVVHTDCDAIETEFNGAFGG